jgi:hypothetical protein
MKFFFYYFLGYNCLFLFFFAYGNTKEMANKTDKKWIEKLHKNRFEGEIAFLEF